MSYFEDSYPEFRYKQMGEESPGFRLAQLGAIHSAAAHFSLRTEPGIITMPTGSGKTAVLIACAYVLQSKRVLIITPSRLVREQIAEEVTELATLKKAEALPQDFAGPRVFSTRQKVSSLEDWEAMREYDVVVGTIQSISPGYEDIPEPPNDLFDLVLIDEAHHSPARTWKALLEHFPQAKKLLFTATPFRQDQKEIVGRFLFTYGLHEAYRDGIFGQISYRAVIPTVGENHDEAIARATEQQFRADTAKGFRHKVMIRTDGKARAEELRELYGRITHLRLALITGNNSLRHVKKVLTQLGNDELDGIICVNMLGEGFNFPSLKIAAVHAPHKSLGVTLQFVGRFARTVGENLGPASFLAIPSDIEIETERLYDSRAIWQDMIINLAAARVNQEAEAREILQSFEPVAAVPDLSDFSLHTLEPYYHVKVYQLQSDINIETNVEFPSRFQVVYRSISLPHSAAIFITREIRLPRWAEDDRLANIESDLFIFYYHQPTRLLFLCSSRRTEGLYQEIVETFAAAQPKPLPLAKLNKALNDLTSTEFFNVGMRNRVNSNSNESYRIIAGGNADKSVQKSDSRLYHRGHAFGRAIDNGNEVTIGLSSASKIWSNKSSKLPELIQWCTRLGEKISSGRIPVTNSGLDYLSPGEELEELPDNIIVADWPKNVYLHQPVAVFNDERGKKIGIPLVDFDLNIDMVRSTPEALMLTVTYGAITYSFTFSFDTERFFEPASDHETEINIQNERGVVSLIHYINDVMLYFYTSDLSSIEGYSIFKAPEDGMQPLDVEAIEVKNWAARNMDIQSEFENPRAGLITIHDYLRLELEASDSPIVYYDHGTGEIADFISFEIIDDRLLIRFYHAKKSLSPEPGHRLDAMNDLLGQVVKSVTWGSKKRITETIRRRFTEGKGSHTFIRGDLAALEALIANISPAQIDYEFVAVQPGLRKAGLPEEISHMMASASDYLIRGGFKPLKFHSS